MYTKNYLTADNSFTNFAAKYNFTLLILYLQYDLLYSFNFFRKIITNWWFHLKYICREN